MADRAPDKSPYIYCFSNPVKLTDPDGKWPWDNPNVRRAREFASKWGWTFQKWEGQNGLEYASVSTSYIDEDGTFTVAARRFLPSAESQHSWAYNILHYEGGSKGDFGAHEIDEQDCKVAFGIMGVLAGGMAIGADGLSFSVKNVISVTGLANAVDDIGSNERGESISQQVFNDQKEGIGWVKNGLSVVCVIGNIWAIKDGESVLNYVDATNTSISSIISFIQSCSDDEDTSNH